MKHKHYCQEHADVFDCEHNCAIVFLDEDGLWWGIDVGACPECTTIFVEEEQHHPDSERSL